ncbi:MAG: CBS domain-containing protein [Candidatus Bathyarchaeota archaeon]|nr:CBS domain-containing protein [Candidatus Bathyarchaeota archaeon]
METKRDLRRLFPSVLDRAIKQSKRHYLVRDIMATPVVTISPEATMNKAARIMGERRVGSLIVKRDGDPVGIVTERDLLSNVIAVGRRPEKVKVEAVMSSPLITIGPTATIKEAAQTMIRKKGRLAVFDEGELVGIITASDLIQSLPETDETVLKADQIATKRVMTADEKVTVDDIAKTMGRERIGSVVITSEGRPVGIFTERDLLTTFLAEGRPLSTPVGEVTSRPLMVVSSGSNVLETAFIMATNRIRRLPLVDENDELVGIVTARDLVEAYAK